MMAYIELKPFCSETPQETYRKILNWKRELFIPDDVHLSHEAEDLINSYTFTINNSLMCESDLRLGRKGATEIKEHPFFSGVDWSMLRDMEAPFVPELKSMTDTSYFPTDDLRGISRDLPRGSM